MAAAFAFAIGSRPGLSHRDALDLADLLALDEDIVAVELAAHICAQAARNVHETTDLELSREELQLLARVFSDSPGLLRLPAFADLDNEVRFALTEVDL